MTWKLYTIGFTQKTAEEFFGLLQGAGVRRLIDIRENRSGQLSGFAKYPDIAFFLKRLCGVEYVYEPLLAPSPEIREAYKKTRNWNQYETSFLQLMQDRTLPEHLPPLVFEDAVAFLCSEPGPEKCHRRLVAEMVAKHAHESGHVFVIEHLVVEKPRSRRKTETGRRRGIRR